MRKQADVSPSLAQDRKTLTSEASLLNRNSIELSSSEHAIKTSAKNAPHRESIAGQNKRKRHRPFRPRLIIY